MAIDKRLIDQLLADYKKPEDIIGENGLLKQLTKAILERALQAELTDHLGYEKHDPAQDTTVAIAGTEAVARR
jgi:putative transposase